MTSYKSILVITISLFLIACSPDKNVETQKAVTAAEPELSVNTSDTEINSDLITDECGSLKPLLQLLPKKSSINGLAEVYRGCTNSSEQIVSVIYANEGEEYTEYEFKIYVLNSESPYAKNNIMVEGANAEQQSFINKTFKATGDMRKSILETCRNYDQKPVVHNGRNPLISKVQNLDVCVMDNMDANNEIWNAFAINDDLEFRLELEGLEAAAILKTETARDHLMPLFNEFELNVNP